MPNINFTETSLYKNAVKVKFFPDSHIYMVNGKRKTGVTTIIGIKDKSVPLVSWATDLCKEYLLPLVKKGIVKEDILEAVQQHRIRKEKAADLGTKVHNWCEHYIKNQLKVDGYEELPGIPDEPEAVIGVNSFLGWVKSHKVKFVSSERVIYSKKHDYIGTMDIEAVIDGEHCLVDLKTSNSLYNTVNMQTAAYVRADEEAGTKKYKGRWAIRLSKETEKDYLKRMEEKGKTDFPAYVAFEAKYLDETDNIERDYKAFLACLTLFRWDKETDYWLNRK